MLAFNRTERTPLSPQKLRQTSSPLKSALTQNKTTLAPKRLKGNIQTFTSNKPDSHSGYTCVSKQSMSCVRKKSIQGIGDDSNFLIFEDLNDYDFSTACLINMSMN